VTADGKPRRLLFCGLNPHGLRTNADETVFCVAMTNANVIWRHSLMSDGDVTSVGTFVQLSGPDGLALIEDGGLVVTHARVGVICVFDARGRPLDRINSAASDCSTNIAFGGPDNRTPYTTDAGGGLLQRAHAPVAGRQVFSHAGRA